MLDVPRFPQPLATPSSSEAVAPRDGERSGLWTRHSLARPLRLQQLTFSQRAPNATALPRPGFVELPKCLARVLLTLSTASERLVRLIELRAQLRDGSAQEFEFGALLVAQFDAPIPCLIGLSHRQVFGVGRRAPPRRRRGMQCDVAAGYFGGDVRGERGDTQ
jgi:hypothetical protein